MLDWRFLLHSSITVDRPPQVRTRLRTSRYLTGFRGVTTSDRIWLILHEVSAGHKTDVTTRYVVFPSPANSVSLSQCLSRLEIAWPRSESGSTFPSSNWTVQRR